ncbi:MAG: Rieske 2Fe-2S domain-containing protein [Gammaproteobacteria bacterium]|nr:Rieske 2Fe-2S domain-containing protein [Gammaproteobacteria bacterium]
MLSSEDNARLTRTGPDTPMGNVFRAYWMPALLSSELPEPDCPPKRVRLLGEDFVAFRDTRGRVGIVEPVCPHRGANLFFGRVADCGIRCSYHGWKFDHRGNCLEIPTLAPEAEERVRPRAAIRALEARESGDVIWAYMGDGPAPELPRFEFAEVPPEHRFVSKKLQQCNWAQACEGGLDTAHFSYLHAGIRDGERVGLHEVSGPRSGATGDNEPPSMARFRWLIEDGRPQFTVLEHDAGLLLCASRQADGDQLYWRMTQFLMPNHSLAPGNFPDENNLGNTWVPIDDVSCWIFCYCWNPDRPLTEKETERLSRGWGVFPEMEADYVPLRRRENDYLIDRTLQRESSFTGIRGISEQDQAIADSQGLIADRTRELLGQTDLGVVRFRNMVLAAASGVEEGKTPKGADCPDAYLVRSGDFVAPADAPVSDVVKSRFGTMSGVGVS